MSGINSMKYIILFDSTHWVIMAERLCQKAGIPCQAIPVPRQFSSDCGIALEISENNKINVKRILKDNSINAEFHKI
ncbi:MAG: DUF3343 domain-containing protein [Chitinivibrionales bacterium]